MQYFESDAEVILPKWSDRATIINVDISGGKVIVVVASRSQLKNVPKRIDQTGAYILLSYINKQSQEYSVYVGISKIDSNGIVKRVKIHKADKDRKWWERAIFITGSSDLTTSIFVELESQFIQEFQTYKSAILTNKVKGSKHKLGKREVKYVEQIQGAARAILWMLGYSTEIEKEKQDTPRRKKKSLSHSSNKLPKSAIAVRLKHLLEAGELQVGDQLVYEDSKFKPKIKIVEGGNLIVEGLDGEFTSVVTAFKAFRASVGANSTSNLGGGWISWIVKRAGENLGKLLDIRERYCSEQGIRESKKTSHSLKKKPHDDPLPSSSTKKQKPVSARAVRLEHLFEAGEIHSGDQFILNLKKYNPIVSVTDQGDLVVEGVPDTFSTPMKAFQAYRGSLGERTDGGHGGAWWNWDVKHTDGESEELIKIRERYCRNNNIPGKK